MGRPNRAGRVNESDQYYNARKAKDKKQAAIPKGPFVNGLRSLLRTSSLNTAR